MIRRLLPALLIGLLALPALALEPISYTFKTPAPENHIAEVTAVVPTDNRATLDLMMPVWTPGYYRVEDYTARVQDLTATGPDGTSLKIEKDKNRWHVATGGAASITISYKLLATQGSVTSTYVGADMAVINGGSAFITLAEHTQRPHEVAIELPPQWKQSITALDDAPDGKPNHYRADDFDTLVDSPIIAGNLVLNEFELHGKKHIVADVGDIGQWDSKGVAENLKKIIESDFQLFGEYPYKRYVFLNVFRRGAGGLEHKNCCLLTSSSQNAKAGGDIRWLSYASHEYFHGYNVKRLRPVELGPFDYENPPHTSGLWVAEGLSVYYQDLMVSRAGVMTQADYLSAISANIRNLQTTPGRLKQTLSDASLDVWTTGGSGIGGNKTTTISYYVKGPVVGFLLDAKIRHQTDGQKSLDDVMRLEYRRYGGAKGFTAEEFRQTASDAAGLDLKEWMHQALDTTNEVDYTEALDWYGLQFAPTPAGTQPTIQAASWKLEPRADATEVQKSHLKALAGPTEVTAR